MGDITVTNNIGSDGDPPIDLHIPVHRINAIQSIDAVKSIAPVAAHIKEVNHIDPISIESLHVRAVRNVEPLQIEKLNITNLPAVNLSIRQLPSVDVSVRRVPPLSIGLHQLLEIPSDYTVRAAVLGFECFRVRIQGRSVVVPRDENRRETSRTLSRSFQEVAASGNPAIPSRRIEKSVTVEPMCLPLPSPPRPRPMGAAKGRSAAPAAPTSAIRFGAPAGSFALKGARASVGGR